MLRLVKRNYGWVIVTILAALPLLFVYRILDTMISQGIYDPASREVGFLYHVTGEFAIRWMVAVLTCTPFFILFGVNNLFVRQAMGISCAIWSLLHFVFFIWIEGFLETFTYANYIAGLIAVLILIPLLITSNRKSINRLKTNWKKIQQFAYLAFALSILHVALLDKTWVPYAVVVGVGFVLRIPHIKNFFINLRSKRKAS